VDRKTRITESGVNFSQLNSKNYVPRCSSTTDPPHEGASILMYSPIRTAARRWREAGQQDRYKLQEWLVFIATEIHKNFSPVPQDARPTPRETLQKRLDLVADHPDKAAWLVGEKFTVRTHTCSRSCVGSARGFCRSRLPCSGSMERVKARPRWPRRSRSRA